MEIQRAALGRAARPGDLYNAITDSFCDGSSIFGSEFPASLIQVFPNKSQKCDIASADSRSDRCDNLHLQGELKLSVFGLDVPLSGCAEYCAPKYGTDNESIVSVVYQCRTNTEKLDLFSDEAANLVSLDRFSNCEATHVVCEVERGMDAVLALHYNYTDVDEKKKIEEELSKILKESAVKRILATGNDEKWEVAPSNLKGARIELNTDLVLPGQQEAKTLEDYVRLLKKVQNILKEDAAKAKPVTYTLVSLNIVARFSKGRHDFAQTFKTHDEAILEVIVRTLDDLDKQVHSQTDILEKKRETHPLSGISLDEKDENWDAVLKKVDAKKQQIGSNIRDLRQGKVTVSQVLEILDTVKPLLEEMDQCFEDQFKGDEKATYIAKLKQNGVFIVTDVKDFRLKLQTGHYFVFFANLALMDKVFLKMAQTFEELYQKDSQKCILYDFSVHCCKGISEHCIIYYIDGKCAEDDIARITKLLQDCNVMKYTVEPRFGKPPDNRAQAEMRCPKNCGNVKRKWICYYCQKTIYYGFNNHFYCGCGESDVRATQWWCQDPKHGMAFGQFPEFLLFQEISQIPRCKECNILLLGETGSGKSTWINSIANYVVCKDLETAMQRPSTCLIPSSFYIQTDTCEGRMVNIGESEDEVFTMGQSATQKPKTYSFMYNNIRIRLIDVPGICDTRGPEQDKRNFDLILQKLQTVTELHAICILLTPDSSRLTLALRYCINELLTYLHKSAAKNIVFCFTKTRQTLYRAGQTLPMLKSYLEMFEKDRNVKIALDQDTMYFFDNEAFKFLCALEDGISFSADEENDYKKSWDKSRAETFRLLKYVVDLEPHKTREMVSLNEARRIIVALTRPLADITDNINLNISLVKEAKRECEMLDLSVSDLESRLQIKQVTLAAIPTKHPRTVCASSTCSEVRTLPETNIKVTHFKQICHKHCYLEGTEVEKYPDPRLQQCCAMVLKCDHFICQTCGCNWELHLHVNYRQEQLEITVVDKTTELLLKEKKNHKVEKHHVLAAYDRQFAALEARRQKITNICANFGAFLECNSIMPYNDAFIDYLTWAIKIAEQDAYAKEDAEKNDYLLKAANLRSELKKYTEEVEILKAAVHSDSKKITSDDVVRMKEELYSLSSDDCDIAKYLKVLEDAKDRLAKREDYCFEADEYAINPERKKRLSNTSWFSKTFKRIPFIDDCVTSSQKNPSFTTSSKASKPETYSPSQSYAPIRKKPSVVPVFQSVAPVNRGKPKPVSDNANGRAPEHREAARFPSATQSYAPPKKTHHD